MNTHKLLIEIESIEYFCDALKEQIERQNSNALWLAEELNYLSHRAKRDIETFKEKAEDALDEIRRKIESACDQIDELRQAEQAAKDETIIAAAPGDEGRVA